MWRGALAALALALVLALVLQRVLQRVLQLVLALVLKTAAGAQVEEPWPLLRGGWLEVRLLPCPRAAAAAWARPARRAYAAWERRQHPLVFLRPLPVVELVLADALPLRARARARARLLLLDVLCTPADVVELCPPAAR